MASSTMLTTTSSSRKLQHSPSLSAITPLFQQQIKMPVRLFPANRVLSSTHRGLSTLHTELRAVDSSQPKSRSDLTHLRLRFDLLVDTFADEKVRLGKKAFTRVLYRRDVQNVEKDIVRVRRDMERTSRNVEWVCKQMEMSAGVAEGQESGLRRISWIQFLITYQYSLAAPNQLPHTNTLWDQISLS